MGSSKKEKKEKKKKKRRYSSGEENSRNDYDDYYNDKKSSKKSKYDSPNRDSLPQTEEYVYDYSGQEMVQGSRKSPDNSADYWPSKSKKERKRKKSPPLAPPGTDWGTNDRDDLEDGEVDWKDADDMRRDREYQEEVDRKYREKQKADKRRNKSPSPPQPSSKEDASLSIEETNKLREKLGLKPLQVGGPSSEKEEKSYADREDVHKPATNISEKKHSDKMRDKMDAIREKRKINQKLKKVKGLGEEDDPAVDSAAAWVAKSRVAEKEKKMAAKRAQMLEEMDEEFGVSDLIDQSVPPPRVKREPTYSSKDLRGLTVQHKASDIKDGGDVVLTLEDKDILDDDNDDTLVNVNIKDDERARQNIQNKNKRPGYQAYDEVDDETGMLKVRNVLDKYDDEIEGAKKQGFTLDNAGKADGEDTMEQIRETLKAQQVSLEMAAPSLARDFFTEEEMVKFKKPKKKVRKVRKRELLKADDLLRLDVDSLKDRGSRKNRAANKTDTKKKQQETNDGEEDMDIVPSMPDELDFFVAVQQQEEPEPIMEDDEAEQELQIALQRTRRTKMKNEREEGMDEEERLQKMAMELLNKPEEKTFLPETMATSASTKSKKKGKGAIVLDSTSEFCRTLGELPTVGSSRNNKPEPKVPEKKEVEEMTKATTGGWEQVDMSEPMDTAANIEEEEDEDVLEAEPIPHGIAATLELANMKGYLKDGKEKVRKFDPLNLPETKASIDIEKLRDEEKGRYSGRGGYDRDRDRDRYDPYAFKEKSNYKPEFKLEYVDNKGRNLNQKEAFRLLSHKFHGKGSGKLKTEKRAKKLIEEKKLQMMSSIDTPLNTASMFKEKQKQSQSAHIVLSGGGKNLLSNNTLKK